MPKAPGAPARAITSGQSSAPANPADEIVDAEIVEEDEFTSLEEAEEFVKALYFGTESTGKTTAAAFMANLPGDGDVIVINAEAGFKKRPLKALGVRIECLKIWNPPGNGVITYEKLERLYFRTAARLREDPHAVKGVIMDSGTEITNKILEAASWTMYEREQRNMKKADEDKRYSPEVVELQDYGLMTQQMRKLIRKFRDLPCHFAMTALETEAQGEGEFSHSKKQAAPEFTPKLRTSILGYVDVALRLSSETLPIGDQEQETLITGRTKPSALVRGKDRLGVLPRDMPEPRFDRIVDYINGDVVWADDEVFPMYAKVREQAAAYKEQKAAAKAAK
ncbi:RecA-like DNA recombinase [Streptomyces phage Araceli]|nr:DNA recombinase [Streptomyces phage Henoccus]AWY07372.1 DNA recombinase [Streptomyces phage JackieB]QFG07867.1 RecA-like DNA recombinase [Streptomyces phage Araceli]